MTASPTPPPGLPRKPGLFDAPAWGWFLLVGTLASAAYLLLTMNIITSALATTPFVGAQLGELAGPTFWGAVSAATAGPVFALSAISPLVYVLLPIGLALARYRARLAALLPVYLLSFAAPFLVSWARGGGEYAEPTFADWSLGLGLGLVVAGGVLTLFESRRGRRRVTLAAGVTGTALLGFAGLAGWLGYKFGFGEVLLGSAYPSLNGLGRWAPAVMQMDRILPSFTLGLALVLLVLFLLERLAATRPSRGFLLAIPLTLVAAGALTALRAPPSVLPGDPPAPRRFDVLEERFTGYGVSFAGGGRWHANKMYLRRDVSSQVKEMLASGEIRQEVEFAYEILSENAVDLSRDPFADSLSYFLAMRSANPGRDSVWWAKSVGDRDSRRPLSDDQVAAWRETVLTLPTGLGGYFGLLENLIGSGRREGALELVGRVEEILARIPQKLVAGALEDRGEELARLTQAARELHEPDGLARSLTVKVVGEDGLPVQGVPVGVYQVFGFDRNAWLGRNWGVTATPLPHSPEGEYETTDAAGEVRFTGLKGVAYGVTVITGWPGSGMESMRFVAPRDPIPEVLPPGESIVLWQVLSPGLYTMVGRQAVFDPPVSDGLVLEALCMTINGGNGCPMDVRPDRLYDTWFESARRAPKSVYFVGFTASGVAEAIWVNAPSPDPTEGE